MPKIGVIGGSGLYEIEGVKVKENHKITTPYGEPSDVFRICEFEKKEFAFISRHGIPHHIPPHRINYRANVWGLKKIGVERILSVNAVGGITAGLKPADIIIPDQIIDMTHGRENTFYDRDEVVHIDFTYPYCRDLRNVIIRAGDKAGAELKDSGTYVCTNGPRLESSAEIRFFLNGGADMVGMTTMPEASLSRELEMCYAGIAVVTNYAPGVSDNKLTIAEVVETMKESTEIIKRLLKETLALMPEERQCECKNALKDAWM